MASIIVPILTKSEYLVSLYMVITTRSRITNKNRIYVSEEYILQFYYTIKGIKYIGKLYY